MLKNYRILFLFITTVVVATSLQAAPKLPENLEWITNDTDEVFSSQDAIKGGAFNAHLLSFPLTLRVVGPDSNGGIYSAINGNKMRLVVTHPNTSRLLPSLATHWAYSDDNKTMYFKLNPKARWSDGHSVTAEDYVFTLKFMRSKEITDPWINNTYNNEVDEVTIFDDHTISVSSTNPRPRNELYYYVSINPKPEHFYQNIDDFVKEYNWKIVPNTGPYQISEIKKGKSILFTRKKDWWAKDLKYYKNRFNVDKINYTVIRESNLSWELFKKGKIDVFSLTLPNYWHEKSKDKIFDNGYAKKLWFYNAPDKFATGMWLNQDHPVLSDRNVRLGIAHSLNINKVIHELLRNDYFRKHAYSAGYTDYTDNSIKAREYDLDKADNYFNKAGWSERGRDGIRKKNNQRLSLSVTYNFDQHTPRLVVLKEEFKKAGLELMLNKMDGASMWKYVLEKKHDIWWGAGGGDAFPNYKTVFHSDYAHKSQTNNMTNTDSEEMDQLIEAYDSALSVENRIKLSREIENLIHKQSAWIPTYEVPYTRIGYWQWFKMPNIPGTKTGGIAVAPFDFTASDFTTDGGMFWLDEELKENTLTSRKEGKIYPAETIIDTTYKIDN